MVRMHATEIGCYVVRERALLLAPYPGTTLQVRMAQHHMPFEVEGGPPVLDEGAAVVVRVPFPNWSRQIGKQN